MMNIINNVFIVRNMNLLVLDSHHLMMSAENIKWASPSLSDQRVVIIVDYTNVFWVFFVPLLAYKTTFLTFFG